MHVGHLVLLTNARSLSTSPRPSVPPNIVPGVRQKRTLKFCCQIQMFVCVQWSNSKGLTCFDSRSCITSFHQIIFCFWSVGIWFNNWGLHWCLTVILLWSQREHCTPTYSPYNHSRVLGYPTEHCHGNTFHKVEQCLSALLLLHLPVVKMC